MNTLPFVISPEATASIEKVLIDIQRELRVFGHERTLMFVSESGWKKQGILGGWYTYGGQLILGCSNPGSVRNNPEFDEFEIVGFRVYINKRDVEKLKGKRIELNKGKDGSDIWAVKEIETDG